jgi:hypothetical protein
MKRGLLRRHLTHWPRVRVGIGLATVLLAVGFVGFGLSYSPPGMGPPYYPGREPSFLVVAAILALLGCFWIWVGGWRIWSVHRHPSWLALSRHGPPDVVAASVDAELTAHQNAARIGHVRHFFQTDREASPLRGEVWITPNWLIYLMEEAEATGFVVMRLDALVWTSPSPAHDSASASLTLADRHGVELTVTGSALAVGRLRAELLARTPWVLTHFDAETRRRWDEDRGQIIAEVDRRRIAPANE